MARVIKIFFSTHSDKDMTTIMTGLTTTSVVRTTGMPMPTNLATPTVQATPQSLIIITGVPIANGVIVTFTGVLMLFAWLFYRKHSK